MMKKYAVSKTSKLRSSFLPLVYAVALSTECSFSVRGMLKDHFCLRFLAQMEKSQMPDCFLKLEANNLNFFNS